MMEPFCFAAEQFTRCTSSLSGYNKTPQNTWDYLPTKAQEIAYRAFITLAALTIFYCYSTKCVLLSMTLFLTGKFFRVIAFTLQKDSFTHALGSKKEIPFQTENGFIKTSVVFANILGPHGGYNYTNGGSVPFRKRMDPLLNVLMKNKPDTIGFLEVYDTAVSERIIFSLDRVKASAHHFFQLGAKILLGNAGGEMISTTRPVHSFQRIAFKNNSLLVDNEYIKLEALNRGFSILALKADASSKEPFIYLILTHLIHGVDPSVKEDKNDQVKLAQTQSLRRNQLEEIRAAIPENANAVLFGDFNIDRDSEEGNILKEFGELVYTEKDPSSEKPTTKDATCTEYFINEWINNITWTEWLNSPLSYFTDYESLPQKIDDEDEIVDNYLILKIKKDGDWVENENVECLNAKLVPLWNKSMPINCQNPLSDHHGIYAEFRINQNAKKEESKKVR